MLACALCTGPMRAEQLEKLGLPPVVAPGEEESRFITGRAAIAFRHPGNPFRQQYAGYGGPASAPRIAYGPLRHSDRARPQAARPRPRPTGFRHDSTPAPSPGGLSSLAWLEAGGSAQTADALRERQGAPRSRHQVAALRKACHAKGFPDIAPDPACSPSLKSMSMRVYYEMGRCSTSPQRGRQPGKTVGSRLVDRECATDRATTALSTRSTTHLTADLYTCFCALACITLWAHEDLNLGPLPCQGMNDRLSTSTNAT